MNRRTDASKASSIRALGRHPKGLPSSLFGSRLWDSRGYQWPEPHGRWRVALEQPGRLEDERCYHSPESMRHRLNLTVRGGVFVRKVLIENLKAVGVEVESGGEIFNVEADRVVLSAGAIKSPHLLMLSGSAPKTNFNNLGYLSFMSFPEWGRTCSTT